MRTERWDWPRIAQKLRVREHIRERSYIRNPIVDVKGVEEADCVVFVKMELACGQQSHGFGDSFVAEFDQRTGGGVARTRGNDEISVRPRMQLRAWIVRSRQHHALQEHGPHTRRGQRGKHLAQLELSRRLDHHRLSQIGVERAYRGALREQQVHAVGPGTRQKIVRPRTPVTRVAKTTNQAISDVRHGVLLKARVAAGIGRAG